MLLLDKAIYHDEYTKPALYCQESLVALWDDGREMPLFQQHGIVALYDDRQIDGQRPCW
jgi:hypothetical protein